MTEDLTLGSISISVLLTIIMGLIYRTWDVPGKYKPWIAIFLGMTFAGISMWASSDGPLDKTIVVNFIVTGFMVGATAVGLNEIGLGKLTSKKKSDD